MGARHWGQATTLGAVSLSWVRRLSLRVLLTLLLGTANQNTSIRHNDLFPVAGRYRRSYSVYTSKDYIHGFPICQRVLGDLTKHIPYSLMVPYRRAFSCPVFAETVYLKPMDMVNKIVMGREA